MGRLSSHDRASLYYQHAGVDSERASATPDFSYWGLHPPKEVWFASQSVRKALMAAWLSRAYQEKAGDDPQAKLHDYFPVEKAEDLKQWFMDNVSNGDGALPLETMVDIGEWHGVPVIGVAASGESHKNNDPRLEAIAKANYVRVYPVEPEESDVIVVAGDTIERVGVDQHSYGKPSKEPDYPKQQPGESDADFAAKLQRYEQTYIEKRFLPGQFVQHIVGMCAIAMLGVDTTVTSELVLRYKIPEHMPNDIHIDPDSASGGLTQELVLRSREFAVLTELQKAVIISEIMGMPYLAFMEMAKDAQKKRGERFTFDAT
ncbi:MAG TPA: hypothetical protein VJ246_02540 [Patescibacteria group bacterium]|nr:hypothetical protein [Patescibacteria group bacterium]